MENFISLLIAPTKGFSIFLIQSSLIPQKMHLPTILLFPLNKLKIDDLLNPQLLNQIPIEQWNQELEKFHLNWSLHPGIHQQAFHQEIYKQNLNPFLLPPEIGLPVQHSLLIQTSPMIWQTYFYLDVLSKKRPKDVFSFQETERYFNNEDKEKRNNYSKFASA